MISSKPFDGINEDNGGGAVVAGSVDLTTDQNIDGNKTFNDLRVSNTGTLKLEDTTNIGAGILGCNASGFVVKHSLADNDGVVMKAGVQAITGDKNFLGGISYYNTNDVVFNGASKIMTYDIVNNAVVAGSDVEYCKKQNCVFTNGAEQTIDSVIRFNDRVIIDKDTEFYSERVSFGLVDTPNAGWYSIAIIDDANPNPVDGEYQTLKGASKIVYVDYYNHHILEIEAINNIGLFSHINLKSYGRKNFFYSVDKCRILGGGGGAILQMYIVSPANSRILFNTPDFQNSGWRIVKPTTSQTSFTDANGFVRTLVNGATMTQLKIVDLNATGLDLVDGGTTFSNDLLVGNKIKCNEVLTTLNEISAPTNLTTLTLGSNFSGGFIVSGTIYWGNPKIHKEKNLVRLSGLISTASGNFNNGDFIATIPNNSRPATSKNFVCAGIDGGWITIQIYGTNYSTENRIEVRGTHSTSTIVLDQISYFIDI